MRQVARRLRDGRLELVDVPKPAPPAAAVLVRTEASVISSGTERATLEVARKGLLAKARARPDQARQVLERVRREGVRSTAKLVRQRLDELGPLGYSAAGTVVAAGELVADFSTGDRVAIAGAGFANHAEVDVVPHRLCARIPEGVEMEDAAFTTLGAIALHGFRRAEVAVGANVAVIGLGLIGQLAVRIARAAGCRVLGIDVEESQLELCRRAGAEAVLRSQLGEADRRLGSADAVLICASSQSSDPIELAAELARDRAPVVVVGDVRMSVPRAAFYDKELDLRLSRSYGPGRYDPDYELHGHDYPIGYVRWTEQRNMEAFLTLVADGRVRPSELVTRRYPFSAAEDAFELLVSERPVAVVLAYDGAADGAVGDRASANQLQGARYRRRKPTGKPRFGLVGAGNFATATIVPGLLDAGFEPVGIASATGLSATSAARRFEFSSVAANAGELIGRDDLDLIVIATRHDTHAALAALALDAGHAVYVEKPLSLDDAGLRAVVEAQGRSGAPLVVGFNRRHSPHAVALRDLAGPRLMSFRVNAGPLPPNHWSNDPRRGGGRLLGEGCHFVDFLCDQAASDPVTVSARGFRASSAVPLVATDNFAIQLGFADGSVGDVHYAADAPVGPGKERFEVSAPGTYAEINDFRTTSIWRGSRRERLGGRRQDKGFAQQFSELAAIVRGEAEPPAPESFYVSTLATLAALRSLGSGVPEPVVAVDTAPAS